MKRLFQGIFIPLLAVATVGCAQQDDEPIASTVTNDEVIEFETSIDDASPSRSGITTVRSEHLTDFGVFAYYTGTEKWSAYASGNAVREANLMNDQQVTRSDQSWTYSPVKYWPGSSDTNTSYFAWAPYSKRQQVTLNTTGTPTLTYSILASNHKSIDPNKMFDLLTANCTDVNKSSHAKSVKLNFNHNLARVNLQVCSASTIYDENNPTFATKIFIKDVKLSGKNLYGSGDIDLTTDQWQNRQAVSGEISLSSMLNTDDELFNAVSISSTTPKSLFNDNDYLYLIPTESSSNGDLKITVNYDVVTFDSHLASGYTKIANSEVIALKQSLEQGKAYTFTIAISLDEINFDADTEAWCNLSTYSLKY
jgi:hypothetical protein